jgi:hypothetical protein
MYLFNYLNEKYKQTNYYKNKFIDAEKFRGTIPYDIEIVNLGSSQPKFAFDYTNTGMIGMNWAVQPQTFEYDFFVLKKFHVHLKKKAFVLIPVCPFNFFLYRYSEDSRYYKYYTFLEPKQIIDYSPLTKRFQIDYPILTAKHNLIRLIKDVPADRCLEIDYNPMNGKELQEHAVDFVQKYWLSFFHFDDLENIYISEKIGESIEKNIVILHDMVDFCLNQNYHPVIMTLPTSKEMTNLIPQSFIDKYVMKNIYRSNTQGVPVLDYWGDKRFMMQELYLDSYVFNKKGREIFTHNVVERLKAL